MKKLLLFPIAIFALFFYSCDEVDSGFDQEEVANALKTALEIGTDSSATVLSAVNGYYGDETVKIPLPPEVATIQTKLQELRKKKSTNGIILSAFSAVGDNLFEDVISSVNHAAEDAATDAAPIFKDAITDLTLTDAIDILNGTNPVGGNKSGAFDSTAATQYFKSTTQSALTNLFAPIINTALDKDIKLKVSANDAFTTLKTTYNDGYDIVEDAIAAEALTAGLFGLTPIADEFNAIGLNRIETNSIGEYSTTMALNGLFHKVGETEKDIRRDPFAWVGKAVKAVSDLLIKVFGGE